MKRNLMDLVPQKIKDFEIRENNLITILVPRFGKNFLAKFMNYKSSRPFIKVNLDFLGSSIWNNIDGKKTVFEISQELKSLSEADNIEEWHKRVALFIKNLKKSDFIKFN